MSDNWVVQNLQNALETWNEKLAEIWQLITTTPQDFKGGGIWGVIVNINGAVQSIGLALLVLFFVAGMVKTCGSFTEVKKPEHALKLFVRFAIAKGAITYGMELMLALFNIVQGTISTIMGSAGFSTPQQTVLPPELITSVEECGFFESIPLWAVTLIGGLFITVMSFILIMTVYGRFFKLYMYTALAPIPLSTFAGEPSQNVGKSFIKSYCAVCLEGAVIVLSCIIFSLFASSPPVVNPDAAAVTQVWSYVGELLFNKMCIRDRPEMAVSKLWPVTVRLATVLDYASNPEKTTKAKSKYSNADYQALRDVVNYVKNGEKTEQELFCEGINCTPAIAREQFVTVKEQFDKTDGIQAYHGYLMK